MTRATFADTSFFAAIINEKDSLHLAAKEIARHQTDLSVTTEFVLLEVANFCTRSHHRTVFTSFISLIHQSQKIEIIPATSELFWQGFELYKNRPDKEWSLTDCISFVVMKDKGIGIAMTADHHFEQAGFEILLK